MILNAMPRPLAGRVTLDQLVQQNAQRAPDHVAILDAPDRPLWTEGAPRRLTWAQVDAAASAAATRLVELGLGTDAVVAIQGPTSSDTLLALLACLRANLIPALLPAGWRRAEATAALQGIGARAIFASGRAGPAQPSDTLRHVAAELFSVRFVCGFGKDPADGVVSFEDCVGATRSAEASRPRRPGNGAEHTAAITWDVGPKGATPLARTHNEWISAGLGMVSEIGLGRDSVLLSTLSPCTFAGLATGLVPALMTGGTLVLHQAFDATVLGVQMTRQAVTHLVLPRVALEATHREGLLSSRALKGIAAVTRRADATAILPDVGVPIAELAVFGEVGLAPLVRSPEGAPSLACGAITAPPGVDGASEVVETRVDEQGVLALRGAMVPRATFPVAGRDGAPPPEASDWLATGFPAMVEGGRIRVLGPRAGTVAIGGQSLSVEAVEALYADMPGAIAVSAAAADDPVLGQRLVLEAVPKPGAEISAASLGVHVEAKGASPLAASADASVGDRRKGSRLAGAA